VPDIRRVVFGTGTKVSASALIGYQRREGRRKEALSEQATESLMLKELVARLILILFALGASRPVLHEEHAAPVKQTNPESKSQRSARF